MNITMLGTGNALVTECYNTCFVISDGNRHFMTDGGGGNTVLRQLKSAGFAISDIRDIFVTHKHIDHLLGVIWVVRMICQQMNRGEYDGEVRIYAHNEVIDLLHEIASKLLLPFQTRFIGTRLHLIIVHDGECKNIIGHDITFFDIHSERTKQFGFSMNLNESKKLTCCGDEPYHDSYRRYAQNSEWLLHESFCLYSQAEIFSPYEKRHSTVKDACEHAEELGVKKLLLYHTEDKNLSKRKELYTSEGRKFFNGKIFVPYDLEVLEL